jgi:hypothetical protein
VDAEVASFSYTTFSLDLRGFKLLFYADDYSDKR